MSSDPTRHDFVQDPMIVRIHAEWRPPGDVPEPGAPEEIPPPGEPETPSPRPPQEVPPGPEEVPEPPPET